ncbi:sugar phosphate isomerase/epimerase [Candidatus Woesearchaeota archaeon]|nr:sugar phosphate isomerase/epimerase [Candidatus Woesearchaeota archaeon]
MRSIGVKIFPNGKAFYEIMEPYIDFVEIMAVEGAEYTWLQERTKSVIIHHEHDGFGINHANPAKRKKNQAATNWAIHLADKFNAEKIIVHAGHIENKECSLKEAAAQLQATWDKRIIFENLIAVANGQYMFCYDKKDLLFLTKTFKTGICLDLSHAIISGMEMHKNPEYFLKELKTLPIVHGHVCDGHVEVPIDQHIHIGDGNFSVKEYLKYIPKERDITLETPRNIEKAKKDIAFLRRYG